MKTDALYQRIMAAARKIPADERVPYGFEKRIMAHLPQTPAVDALAFWARGLWKAAVPCLGIMLLVSAWSLYAGGNDFQTDLELAITEPLQTLELDW